MFGFLLSLDVSLYSEQWGLHTGHTRQKYHAVYDNIEFQIFPSIFSKYLLDKNHTVVFRDKAQFGLHSTMRFVLVVIAILLASVYEASARADAQLSQNATKWKEYSYISNSNGYSYISMPCSKGCRQGGCQYNRCGHEEWMKEQEVAVDGEDGPNYKYVASKSDTPQCRGGMCEFTACVNPTCRGGACKFIKCSGATCDGGGCHYMNPTDTLKEGYCDGGGCKLNGRPIPSSLRNHLAR